MIILGLDTTTNAGSVALLRDGVLCESVTGDPLETHGQRLPGDIIKILTAHNMGLNDVDLYAVCAGPGSFTGIRVGLASIQALALANRRKVVSVPTLEAIAYAGLWGRRGVEHQKLIAPWMNAHRGEVFAALYRSPVSPDETVPPSGTWWKPLIEVAAPTAAAPEMMLEDWRKRLGPKTGSIQVIGNAVEMSRDLLIRNLDKSSSFEIETPSLALIAAQIAGIAEGKGYAISPNEVRPVYVRRPDAVLAREKRLKS
jgi:tRNA threonylcarbamoyladenosine biosynthesis protein TsaB